ncbi:hypothetical protein C8R44DRAFT_989397 [Mycena epipterygia]|nr:hypothetical protein C8R44DRAFT_989397 [Mycena epipterygia]
MGSRDRVPNELWLEMLKNVSEYDRSTVQNFSLTCRTFRGVSRPRLFADLRFTPYCLSDHRVLLPSPTEVDRRLERLNFWCSAEIAPLVRYCDITARKSWEHRNSSEWSFSTDSPYILLDALFERLLHFTGLQRLDASSVHFTQARVDTLCRLPILSELGVYWCTVAPGECIVPAPQALRVSDFCLVSDDKLEYGDNYWIPLLHPDHLRALRAEFNPRTVQAIPSFTNVHRLSVTMDLPTPAQNLVILSKFPAVRVLELGGKGLLTDALALRPREQASAVFPLLREYSGPYQPLPLFLPLTTLTHLIIPRCSPQDFITRVQGIQDPNITLFYVEFNKFDNPTFNTIMELLPRLTELLIRIVVPSASCMFKREIFDARKLKDDEVVDGRLGDSIRAGFKPSTFFLKLADAPILPPSLERLAISWECYEEHFDELSAYKIPDFTQLRDALVARCPGLTWLWLDGFYFMFQWRNPCPMAR